MKIGFIGLGNMGAPMARNLIKAGHELLGFDVAPTNVGDITQDSNARVIRDGAIIFNGKIGSIFREKNQTKQVSAGLECGITLKDFVDFQKNDVIEVYNSTITERTI